MLFKFIVKNSQDNQIIALKLFSGEIFKES